MNEEPYSKREIDLITKPIMDHLIAQDETLKRIEAQTTKTNGRVTVLETNTKDYSDIKDTVSILVNFKWWLAGAVATVTLLGGTTLYFAYKNLVTKDDLQNTKSQFDHALQQYDKVTIHD